MGQVLIRNLDDELIAEYREAAKANHRSLEAELREVLRHAKPMSARKRREVLAKLEKIRRATAGRPQTPSEILIRQLRDGGD